MATGSSEKTLCQRDKQAKTFYFTLYQMTKFWTGPKCKAFCR